MLTSAPSPVNLDEDDGGRSQASPSSSSSSSSSSRNWVYDVFPSFSGEDVRVTFLSHFLKELDRKLITAFKDYEIHRSQSLDPELKQAIRDSRIAIVVFSKNYASSCWCLNELLEIVKCKEEFGQIVIPVFYGLDPCHVRKQIGEFGKIFEQTCMTKEDDDEIHLWRKALTDVANIVGFHSQNWYDFNASFHYWCLYTSSINDLSFFSC